MTLVQITKKQKIAEKPEQCNVKCLKVKYPENAGTRTLLVAFGPTSQKLIDAVIAPEPDKPQVQPLPSQFEESKVPVEAIPKLVITIN